MIDPINNSYSSVKVKSKLFETQEPDSELCYDIAFEDVAGGATNEDPADIYKEATANESGVEVLSDTNLITDVISRFSDDNEQMTNPWNEDTINISTGITTYDADIDDSENDNVDSQGEKPIIPDINIEEALDDIVSIKQISSIFRYIQIYSDIFRYI